MFWWRSADGRTRTRGSAVNVVIELEASMRRVLAAIVLGLASTTAGLAAFADAAPVTLPMSGTPSLAPILKKITPAVVSIETKGHTAQRSKTKKLGTREIANSGSGVVYDARQGFIVTNSHVIEHAVEITVTVADGRTLKAKRIGADPDFDLAVISVQAENLSSIPFGDSRQLEVGDFVLAVGYPTNIGQSVTSGIVSGLHRTNIGIQRFENFIQTDAAIYPGNSGGALVDLQGNLVGINTAFIRTTGTNPGMGFAIPVNTARIIADQIVEFGDIRRGSLGITIDDPTPNVIREVKISAPPGGAVIIKVAPASLAARAGLKSGDVVTSLGNRAVLGSAFLRNRLALLRVGEVADLTVLRDGKPLKIQVTVGEREQRPPPEMIVSRNPWRSFLNSCAQ
jgi:serine protease DegQ